MYISPVEDNYEMFMVNSCGSMQDQWHGYGYMGNNQNFEEEKITERKSGEVIVTVKWTDCESYGYEQYGSFDMLIRKRESNGEEMAVINDCFYSDDLENAGAYTENIVEEKGIRSVRLTNISGRYDIEIANPEYNNLTDSGMVVTIESDDGIVSYNVDENTTNIYRGITGTWYLGIGIENGKVVEYVP